MRAAKINARYHKLVYATVIVSAFVFCFSYALRAQSQETELDTTSPTVFNVQPTGTIPVTFEDVIISLETNEPAECIFSNSVSFGEFEDPDALVLVLHTVEGTTHDIALRWFSQEETYIPEVIPDDIALFNQGETYDVYARCADKAGNFSDEDTVIRFSIESPTCIPETSVRKFLNAKYDSGLAAGNVGDYYHNADGGHTELAGCHLQVTELPETFNVVMTHDPTKVIVGNASIAKEGPEAPDASSRNRYDMMGSAEGAAIAYLQYTNNNAYWYPAHTDYGETDDFHAMSPMVSSSIGSSFTERHEVDKSFSTLAAFRPDVKEKLREEGLLMPTIQMIMRRTRVDSDNEYLTSPLAHPSAFDEYDNWLSMAQMANAITIDKIPPLAKLRLISDTYGGIRGQDYFDTIDVHPHFQTPASIAFVWRNFNHTQKIRVSAADSYDVNGYPLTYTWSVIRGEPSRVRITPLNDQKTEVDIEIDYHPSGQIVPEDPRVSSLVIIGLFAHNGFYYSAPTYITSYTQPNETRIYEPKSKRLTEIQYETNRDMIRPVSVNKTWERDTFNYTPTGALYGWTQTKADTEYDFTKEGYRIISWYADETPEYVQDVSYYQKLSGDMYLLDWEVINSPFLYGEGSRGTPSLTSSPSPPVGVAATSVGAITIVFIVIVLSLIGLFVWKLRQRSLS